MAFRKRLNSREREKLWDRVCEEQGREWPLCNLCGLEIQVGQRWDRSHFPIPKAFKGTEVGVAHERCNRQHGRIVTKLYAKSNRTRQHHIGAFRSSRPLPGGRDDKIRKRMDGTVVPR